MTTIERPSWETYTDTYGHIPPADADNVRDPGYILARIEKALTRAADRTTGYATLTREEVELIALKVWLEDLTRDLRMYTPAADEVLAALTTVAPEAYWVRNRGFCASLAEDRAALYATRLRLIEDTTSDDKRSWTGVIDGFEVTIRSR